MIKNVYCLRNKKLGFWNPPFYVEGLKEDVVENHVRAIRSGQFGADIHIEEFDLYYLGTFDDKTAKLEVADPEFLIAFDSVVANA